MHKLTLDPSTSFGWCLLLDDGRPVAEQEIDKYHYGSWDLGKNKRAGLYFLNFLEHVSDLRRKFDIQEDDLEIVIEGNAYAARGNEFSKHLAEMWLGLLEMYCERRRMTYPRAVTTTSWRSAFINRTQAPKEIGVGLKDSAAKNAKRKWLKNAVMEECRNRGFDPKSDNESDAIGMMYWMLRGGKDHQDIMRAEKKAKTAEKIAQKKLDLKVAA